MRESVCFSLKEMASARCGLIAKSIFNLNANDEEKSNAKQDGEERWTDLPDITDSNSKWVLQTYGIISISAVLKLDVYVKQSLN